MYLLLQLLYCILLRYCNFFDPNRLNFIDLIAIQRAGHSQGNSHAGELPYVPNFTRVSRVACGVNYYKILVVAEFGV